MDTAATPPANLKWGAPETPAASATPPAQPAAAPANLKWDKPDTEQHAPPANLQWAKPEPRTPEPVPTPSMPGAITPTVQSAVDAESARRGIPVWQLRAIARLESGGMKNPETATSTAGAQGVMQLMPDTFKSISKGNIANLTDNVQAGAAYYQTLLRKYGDPVKAAGAYNMGPGAFDEYLAGKRGLPQETANYMANMAALHAPIDRGALTAVPAAAQHLPDSALHGPVKSAHLTPRTQRLPTQKKANLDPKKAAYEWYDQLFGATDAG